MKFVAVIHGRNVPVEVVKQDNQYRVELNGQSMIVDAIRPHRDSISMLIDGKSFEVGMERNQNHHTVYFYDDTIELDLFEDLKYRVSEISKKEARKGPLQIVAPMPGKIIKILVQAGSEVAQDEPLVVVEAMKMQNELKSPRKGKVKHVRVTESQTVSPQQVLLELE